MFEDSPNPDENAMPDSSPADLHSRYLHLIEAQPALRMRDAARVLAVSEAELVAADPQSQSLRPDWPALLAELPALREVMCLTRNEACVHERIGAYLQVECTGGMGLVLGPDIDLRLFLRRWAYGFACQQTLISGVRHSLQFFDGSGEAVHKVYLTEDSDHSAYQRLCEQFVQDPAPAALTVQPAPVAKADRPDADIDLHGLQEAWQHLRDTHDFFGLLNRFQVGRLQALRLVGGHLAMALPINRVQRVLELASQRQEPIMCFVGNAGCLQIHTGEVCKVVSKGGWLNVLDKRFNLHLQESHISSVWLVRKPTEDGMVTSIEVFNDTGELLVQFFGKRKPGLPEREGWRALLAELQP
jgi:putative hemin transport protein